MIWIKVAQNLPSHAKTLRAAQRLERSRFEVSGLLVALWGWMLDNAPSGCISESDFPLILDAIGWRGDPLAALIECSEPGGCGFIEREGRTLRFHDWEEFAGSLLERREKDKERAARNYEKRKAEVSAKSPRIIRELSGAREEKRREDINHLSASSDAVRARATGAGPAEQAQGNATGEFYLTKRKRKLSGEALRRFDEFWTAFDYRHGKAEAADAWLNLKPDGAAREAILAAARCEAEQRPGLVAKGRTPKWAQGWLTARRWEDEPEVGAPAEVEGFTARNPTPEELAGLAGANDGGLWA